MNLSSVFIQVDFVKKNGNTEGRFARDAAHFIGSFKEVSKLYNMFLQRLPVKPFSEILTRACEAKTFSHKMYCSIKISIGLDRIGK